MPQEYYDRFPPREVKLPPYATTNDWKEWERRVWEDLADVPKYAINRIAAPRKEFSEVIQLGKWETSIQSYLAAIVSCRAAANLSEGDAFAQQMCPHIFILALQSFHQTGLHGHERWPAARCL